MIRKGRDNDLFFVCWIVAKVAFETNNRCVDVVNSIDVDFLDRLYEYADVFHCENPDRMSYEILARSNLKNGDFFREEKVKFQGIAGVFHNLIYDLNAEGFYKGKDIMEIFRIVYNHPIGIEIENYRNCLYWQSPECVYECYVNNDLNVMY